MLYRSGEEVDCPSYIYNWGYGGESETDVTEVKLSKTCIPRGAIIRNPQFKLMESKYGEICSTPGVTRVIWEFSQR